MPPRLARLLAAIVATALVTTALWFALRDDKSSKPSKPDKDKNALSIICVEELGDVCRSLASKDLKVLIEDAASTFEKLTKPNGPANQNADAWITLNPWPGMAQAGLGRPVGSADRGNGTVVASAPLGLLVTSDLARCKNWKCILDAEGKVGVPDTSQALSALVQGQVAVSVMGTRSFGIDQFGKFEQQLRSLTSDSSEDLPATMIRLTGSYQAVAGLSFATERAARTVRGQELGLKAITADPQVRADVVVMPLGVSDRVAKILELFTDEAAKTAFNQARWTVGPPKGNNGLPDADVMYAIRKQLG